MRGLLCDRKRLAGESRLRHGRWAEPRPRRSLWSAIAMEQVPIQLARNLARPVFKSLPPTVQWAIRRISYWSTELVLWPFRSELNQELNRMEWRKRERKLRELRSFPEMENSAWKGLGSLGYEIVRHYRVLPHFR